MCVWVYLGVYACVRLIFASNSMRNAAACILIGFFGNGIL